MMSDSNSAASGGDAKPSEPQIVTVRLRRPAVAALWAWLIPGAGHWYQGRRFKSAIYFFCILSTYFFGLALGGGHVVYASLAKNDFRWQYFCQLGVGIPAFPALVQTYRVRNGKEPFWADVMAPPGEVQPRVKDKLALWHERYTNKFEIGTLYTMVAGLMNVLAVFDAYGGPFVYAEGTEESSRPSEREQKEPTSPKRNRRKKKRR